MAAVPHDIQVLRAYKRLFDTEDGKMVLEDLQNAHHIFKPMVGPGPVDPMHLAMCEGARNVILRIMAIQESREN